MGGKDRNRVGRNFGKVFDKARALGLKALHNVLVVHNFVTDIDGRTELLQRPFDNLDGAHHAGTEATRLGENSFHRAIPLSPIELRRCASSSPAAPTRRIPVTLAMTPRQSTPAGPVLGLLWTPFSYRSPGRPSIRLHSNGKIAEAGRRQPPLSGNGSHVQSVRALTKRNCPEIGGREGMGE